MDGWTDGWVDWWTDRWTYGWMEWNKERNRWGEQEAGCVDKHKAPVPKQSFCFYQRQLQFPLRELTLPPGVLRHTLRGLPHNY